MSQKKRVARLIDITPPPRAQEQAPVSTFVHPVELELESAVVSDSLKTLCIALSKAWGSVAPPKDSPDRSRRPFMGPPMTVRALLRFAELRHGMCDDLTPADLRGKCGAGLGVLLRKCRAYQQEVTEAVEGRGDDLIRMVKAFYDQAKLLKTHSRFFRDILMKNMPAIVAEKTEPLPRLVSFLEPFGELQLMLVHEATMFGALERRLGEFEDGELFGVIDAWIAKARADRLSFGLANQVRQVVLRVAFFDLPWTIEQRTHYLVSAIWASVTGMFQLSDVPEGHLSKAYLILPSVEMPYEAKRLEDSLLGGLLARNDPREVYNMVMRCVAMEAPAEQDDVASAEGSDLPTVEPGKVNMFEPEGLWQLLARVLRDSAREASTEHVGRLLAQVELRQTDTTFPDVIQSTVIDMCGNLARADLEACEKVTASWDDRMTASLRATIEKGLAEPDGDRLDPTTVRASGRMAEVLMDRVEKETDLPRALVASVGAHLSGLLGSHRSLLPLPEAMLGRPLGEGHMENLADTLRLLADLWPSPGRPQPGIRQAEDILRLVGPPLAHANDADSNADRLLLDVIAQQLPSAADDAGAALLAWRGRLPAPDSDASQQSAEEEEESMSSVVAPFVLAAAEQRPAHELAEVADRGELSRAASLLGSASSGDALSLRQAELALAPFYRASEEHAGRASALVAASCAARGAPEAVMLAARKEWYRQGAEPSRFGAAFVEAAVQVWQEEGVREAGLEKLRQAFSWLQQENEKLALSAYSGAAMDDLRDLLRILGGAAPDVAALTRLRRRFKLEQVGAEMVAELAGEAWTQLVPGLTQEDASASVSCWWLADQRPGEMILGLVRGLLLDLKTRREQRVLATWYQSTPPIMPSWRIEGEDQKVPWFVPSRLVGAEAGGDVRRDIDILTSSNLNQLTQSLKQDPGMVDRARPNTNGMCMYCGSNHQLQARYVFPSMLGGSSAASGNVAVVCSVCAEFSDHVGTKRWGEALATTPEEASRAWWESQKAANERAMAQLGVLKQQVERNTDTRITT